MTDSQIRRRIKAIEAHMAEVEDASGLLDELNELRAELDNWHCRRIFAENVKYGGMP